MSNTIIWEKYSEEGILGVGRFGKVYKVKDKNTNQLYALKELIKLQTSKAKYNDEIKTIKILASENSISIIDEIETKDYYYIIFDLCLFNLEYYINNSNRTISSEEIKSVLLQLNNVFKEMNKKKIIHRDIKPSNILINIDKLNKVTIKLSDYGSSINIDTYETKSLSGTQVTMAPEVLEKGIFSEKSDIWSLGITIYFMLFKDFPFKGEQDYILLQNIKKNKNLESSGNHLLDDLIKKMLIVDYEKRISWDEYFKHEFFKNKENNVVEEEDNIDFKFFCKDNELIQFYCVDCKQNICIKCSKDHSSHKIISLNQIGLTRDENNKINLLMKEIDNNYNKITDLKKVMTFFYNQMQKNNENSLIYKNDIKNNIKNYFFNFLSNLNKKIKTESFQNFESFMVKLSFSNLKEKKSIQAHEKYITSMASFPSGNLLSVSGDKSIKIYDINLNLIQHIKEAHNGCIQNVCIKDENNFATCSADKSIITWIKKDKYVKNIKIENTHKEIINSIIYCPNGNLISCSWDKTIKIWKDNKINFELIKTLSHSNWVYSILLVENKKILISSGSDGTKFWNYENYQLIKEITEVQCSGKNALKLFDDNHIIIGSKDGFVKIISISDQKIITNIEVKISCYTICVIPEKQIILLGGDDRNIKIYSCDSYECIQEIKEAHNDSILCLIELKNETIASSSEDNKIKIWSF